jgi:hypothetical protein
MEMARTSAHPFQINAVQTLGKMPSSPVINQMLRTLLDTDHTLVRLEAYQALANNGDSSIISRPLGQKFMLDIVPSQGPPIIYATSTGVPRIAVIGNRPALNLPVMFAAMDNRFTISSSDQQQPQQQQQRSLVTIYYRGSELPRPVTVLSSSDAIELIARLSGEGAPGEEKLRFNYCDVVALLQSICDQKWIRGSARGGVRAPAQFVLQESPSLQQTIEDAPPIISEQETITGTTLPADDPGKLGSANGSGMTR